MIVCWLILYGSLIGYVFCKSSQLSSECLSTPKELWCFPKPFPWRSILLELSVFVGIGLLVFLFSWHRS